MSPTIPDGDPFSHPARSYVDDAEALGVNPYTVPEVTAITPIPMMQVFALEHEFPGVHVTPSDLANALLKLERDVMTEPGSRVYLHGLMFCVSVNNSRLSLYAQVADER